MQRTLSARIRRIRVAAAVVRRVLLAVLVVGVLAAPVLAQVQLPDGPGKDAMTKVCGTCHQVERAASVRLTREGWEEVVADMIRRGAKGSDEELAQVVQYLSTHFLGEAARPLNINRATQIELESVAGLLRKEAAALLAYLDKTGPCKALADLKKVPGLDYKKIDARKDFLVCFEALPPPKKDN
jgi:competence protein ComEA